MVDDLLLAAVLFRTGLRRHGEPVAENLPRRHQLAVLTRSTRKRPRLRTGDRLIWVVAARLWCGRHLVARSNDDRGGLNQDDAFLTAGSVAMIVEGTHKIASWRDRPGDWDVAGLPKGPGGRGERLSMDGYAIPRPGR
jgi:hypothetical protein